MIRALFTLITAFSLLTAALAQSAAPSLPTVHPQARSRFVAVLVWHDILPKKDVWFDTTLATFRNQLETIRKRKFNVLSLSALRDHLTRGTSLPPRSLVLTFDDNTLGLYKYAFPLLKKYKYPATLFVHTDYVGVRTVKEHCTWPQLEEMQQSGLITIQSLTCSHPPDLRRISAKQLDHELRDSRAEITKRLGTPVFAFAYTEGKHDRRLAQAVHKHSYALAFTEDGGNACASSNLLQIHRYSILKRFSEALDKTERASPKK